MHVVDVDELAGGHPRLRASDWRSPLIRRLTGNSAYEDGTKTIVASFRPPDQIVRSEQFVLNWSNLGDDFAKCVVTYQEPTITEFAALGVACILLFKLVSLEITEVTRRGERADYWLGDRQMLLEVSGQQSGDMQSLHNKKRDQLLSNPFEKDGYVCVSQFDTAAAQLWHHSFETTQ